MTGSFKGRGNKYILVDRDSALTLSGIVKQLPTFPHRVQGLNHRP